MDSATLTKPVIIQKFGGTTISGIPAMDRIARIIQARISQGYKVIAVVSAMGRGPDEKIAKPGDPYATDTLLKLLPESPEHICLREKDLLMTCGEIISSITLSCHLRKAGIAARARTGYESGILTDGNSNNARILAIIPDRLQRDLHLMDVVVVAGFQGISIDGRITTLGRGGSDTTAIALGHALKAERIEVYTDQKGIFSADPRDVPDAVQLKVINAKDIVHMSWAGAKVLHPRSAELIEKYGLNVFLGNINSPEQATTIEVAEGYEASQLITAIAHGKNVAQFIVPRGDDDDQARLSRIFSTVMNAGISMDMFTVTQQFAAFTVDLEQADSAERHLVRKGFGPSIKRPCQKVSIVGAGMHGLIGVMSRFTTTLTEAGIKILQTVDSHATISALVPSSMATQAQQVLHKEFISKD